MKKLFLLSGMLCSLLCITDIASAQGLMVRPFLVDETVTPRDILTRTITITNEGVNRSIIYATVNEISVDNQGEIKEFVTPVMTDRSNTITSWIEISRARIELNPGESIDVPLTLRIHPYAEPGEYHAFIGFAVQTNRPKAQAAALAGNVDGAILKVTVADESVESLRISDYKIKRFVTSAAQGEIKVEIENTGDATTEPTGEIIFYSARGEEIGYVSLNTDGNQVAPGELLSLTTKIPFSEKLGRFKANLTIHYGENGKSSVFDTLQFYMIPYKFLLAIIFAILFFTILVTVLLKRVLDDDEYDDDEHGKDVPLFVKTGREYKEMNHDITLTKDS